MPHSRRRAILVVLVLAVEAFLALYNPPFHNPDELSHMQHVVFLRDEGRLPDPYAEVPKIQQDKHPPYTYLLGALCLRASDGVFADPDARIRLPGPYELEIRPGRGHAEGDAVEGQLYLCRFVMLLHWGLAAFFLLALADLVWPDRPRFAFALAGIVALVPQAALSGASLTPDTPLSAFCIAATYYLGKAALGRGPALLLGVKAGLFLGLALLSKSAAVFLVPVLVLVLWQRAKRSGRAATLRFALPALLLPLLAAGWWYLRNLVLYGDPFQMQAQVETFAHSIRRAPMTSTFHEVFLEGLFQSFFGYWRPEILLPRPFYYLVAGLLGVAVFGLLALARRPKRSEVPEAAVTLLPAAAVGFAAMFALTWIGNMTVPSAQGRYLYPALGCILVLVGTGWRVGAGLRTDGRASYLWLGLWVLFLLWSFHWVVLRRAGVDRARAAGEGRVLFYEDAGIPGLQPHCVQGLDLPDQGQLGRNTPWRSLSGHPEALVYRFPMPEGARQDLQVRVIYFNPDPGAPHTAHEAGRFEYVTQRMRANGRLVHGEIEVTSMPKEFLWVLPAAWLAGDTLELRIERVAGPAAVVSELWLEEPWLSLERGPPLRVHNRTSRRLPMRLVWKKGALEGSVTRFVEPTTALELAGVDADRVSLSADGLSPWMLREAEAHPAAGKRWFGSMEASGGYRMRGEGELALLPFETPALPAGGTSFLARVHDPEGGWRKRELTREALDSKARLTYRVETGVESLDYILLVGGFRDR